MALSGISLFKHDTGAFRGQLYSVCWHVLRGCGYVFGIVKLPDSVPFELIISSQKS